MDNNLPSQPNIPSQPAAVPPQPAQAINQAPSQATVSSPQVTPQSSGGKGKKILLILVLILLLLGVIGGGYYLFLNSNKTNNASLYNQPTSAVTPTPQTYQPNPNDTTDQAITNDTTASDQNLKNLDTSLNSVDQGLSDQQTNLQ